MERYKKSPHLYLFLVNCVYLADGADTVSTADEGREDHVDAVLDAKQQVPFVLLGHGGQVDRGSGQVAALLAAQKASVLNRTLEGVWTFLVDDQSDQSVVDVDVLADIDHLQSHASSCLNVESRPEPVCFCGKPNKLQSIGQPRFFLEFRFKTVQSEAETITF